MGNTTGISGYRLQGSTEFEIRIKQHVETKTHYFDRHNRCEGVQLQSDYVPTDRQQGFFQEWELSEIQVKTTSNCIQLYLSNFVAMNLVSNTKIKLFPIFRILGKNFCAPVESVSYLFLLE